MYRERQLLSYMWPFNILRFIDTDIYVNNEISMFLRAYLMIFGRMNAFYSRAVFC